MTYEGWENYETWNVALWINNEKPWYDKAMAFMTQHGNAPKAYMTFIETMGFAGQSTPDGVSFKDKVLNIQELNDMMSNFLEK